MASSTWQPILVGDTAARAAAAIDAIAAALATWPAFPADDRFGATLATGEAGHALLFSYLDRARPGAGYAELAAERLERAADRLATSFHGPGLYQGFTGIAWTVEHLRGRLPGTPADDADGANNADDGEDPNEAIDRALFDLLARSPWPEDYELTRGLAGFGAYALERWPGALASACLSRVCERLAELAVPQEVGCAWPTAAWLQEPEDLQSFPRGMYNLGVAHGVPGVLPVLAQAAAIGAAPESARGLLQGAVAWLLSRKLPAGGASVFPGAWGPVVEEGAASAGYTSGWCYGDPGIAAALLVTARAAGEPAWEAEALSLARAVARRAPGGSGARDACLCHGAAGLGHLFNRLYQATGDPELLAAARGWMERALDLRQPGRGVGGFLTWGPDALGQRQMDWRDETTLLTGAAGVALALLAATTAIEPAWDRFLLISPATADAKG
ncbi:MAG TPA: lanthionine synthetase C family protein [Thermoanaerobaculia bacterium]|nr:lanthionine synthetase C family protein [Thermoanaerobaculia bacterium]